MATGRSRCDRQAGGFVSSGRIEAIAIVSVGKVKFFLFRGRGQQGLNRLDAMAAQHVTPIGCGREHRRDGDDRECNHDFDQGETGGGASLRHEVFTGSPA